MFNLDFKGKVVFVTGASRGIGKAIAQNFEQLGATVYGTATSEKGALGITEYLNGHGKGFVMNSLDKQSVEDCFNAVVAEAGTCPDVLINNAGITRDGLFMRMKDNDWNDVLQCNLFACVQLSKLCVTPMMKKRAGRIINIASVMGAGGLREVHVAAYHACKGAVINFTRAAAAEWAQTGVTVNCILPGFFESEANSPERMEKMSSWINAHTPMGRPGNEGELDSTVCFLAADESTYVTGAIVPCDGGWTSI